jgi:hypothetical protein
LQAFSVTSFLGPSPSSISFHTVARTTPIQLPQSEALDVS